MSYSFRPANEYREQHGLFVALAGTANSGKTFSALRLARGIAGPDGALAVLDTEGGRTLHLKNDFRFDVMVMGPPHRPERYLAAAMAAQDKGYAALVIDSFSQEWRGIGGVLDWSDDEAEEMVARKRARAEANSWAFDEARERDKVRMAALIKPKMQHKLMVNGFLGLRIPVIFSIRGEVSIDPDTKKEMFKTLTDKSFPFEVTVAFRLAPDRKGYIDLSDPKSWKMEGSHRAIFRDGDLLSEEHGAKLAEWARGAALSEPAKPAAKKRTWSDVLADLRQLADAAESEGEVEALRGHDLVRLLMDKAAEKVRKEAEIILRDAAERFAPGLEEEAA